MAQAVEMLFVCIRAFVLIRETRKVISQCLNYLAIGVDVGKDTAGVRFAAVENWKRLSQPSISVQSWFGQILLALNVINEGIAL